MEMGIPTPDAGVTLQRVGSEAILYDRHNGRAHVINSSAARIWELCDGQATVGEITGAFAAAYGLPASDVCADVASILTTFRDLHVLEY